MLRFAYWAGVGGVVCSLALALLAWVRAPFASQEAPYLALFISVFVSFVPAILGHPARTHSGGETTVDARALRWAEPWTSVLAVAMLLALASTVLMLAPGGDHFTVDTASLIGRVDRQLMLSFFFAAFHACALNVASSGLRWGLYPSLPPASWFGSLLSPPLAQGGPLELPGAPFSHRTSSVTWLVIGLEVAGVAAAIVLSGSQLQQVLPWPHAKLLLLALLIAPLWHGFLKCCGRITFLVKGDCLLTQHFPFTARNRRIRVTDLRGIQVNAELNDEGSVTHYSLLLVRDHAGTDRLVENLPSAEHARALAQRIDTLIRHGAAGVHARTR